MCALSQISQLEGHSACLDYVNVMCVTLSIGHQYYYTHDLKIILELRKLSSNYNWVCAYATEQASNSSPIQIARSFGGDLSAKKKTETPAMGRDDVSTLVRG